MPEDNVAVVRWIYDALNRGDFDAVFEASAEDFEIDFSNSRGPMSGVYRGEAEARQFLTSFFDPWAVVEFEFKELFELEDGRVVTVNEVRSQGSGSGAEVAATGATIWTIRDGRAAAVTFYQSREDAYQAAGLKG